MAKAAQDVDGVIILYEEGKGGRTLSVAKQVSKCCCETRKLAPCEVKGFGKFVSFHCVGDS